MEKKKILIIDDERSFAELLKMNLEETGVYELDLAFTAMEGIEKIRNGRFDLIFLDVLLPKVEGGEALAIIRKLTPAPVVVMSGFLPPDKERQILSSGASAFVQKPFSLERAVQVIHQAFAAKEKEAAKQSKNSSSGS